MIRTLAAAIAFAALSLPVAAQEPAPIASATSVNGAVQVNTGNDFVPLQTGQALKPGDRIMAPDDASATVTFNDGCTLMVGAKSTVVVPAVSTCSGGVVARSGTPGGYDGGVDWSGFWTVAGVAIIGNAILWNNEDDNDTVSP
jgi:hypothetical protein